MTRKLWGMRAIYLQLGFRIFPNVDLWLYLFIFVDIFDSSSNDSLPVEFKQSIREPKPSKKGLKHEMPLYVPPARKRTGIIL
jgi:hypothetical protein